MSKGPYMRGHSAVSHAGFLFLGGGDSISASACFKHTLYDTKGDVYQDLKAFSYSYSEHAAESVKDYIYYAAGQDSAGATIIHQAYKHTTSGTITTKRALEVSRRECCSANNGINRNYYIGGAYDAASLNTSYNIDANTFSNLTAIGSANLSRASGLNGSIYISGGRGTSLSNMMQYNLGSGQYVTRRALPEGRYAHSQTIHAGQLFIAGGTGGSEGRRSHFSYDINLDIYSNKLALTESRYSHGSTGISGAIFYSGGNPTTTTMQKYIT